MIENYNESKNPGTGEFVDVPKYIGVASVNIVAVNPDNAKLRSFGWSIPLDADEPKYVTTVERDGKQVPSARVRFLVQIQDIEGKPIIPLDFWIRPDINLNKEGSKCKIIDSYGRTAWGTSAEVKARAIPQYASGPATISTPYKPCHVGEEELVTLLMKYLNVTPFRIFDRNKNSWVESKNPGKLTIDHWADLCAGNVKELVEYISLQPDNRVKVVLGVRSTEDNKTYQTFLNTGYIGNGALPDRNTGEYVAARKLIDKYMEGHENSPYSFSASPVKEWCTVASEVVDQSSSFSESEPTYSDNDDLPFGM